MQLFEEQQEQISKSIKAQVQKIADIKHAFRDTPYGRAYIFDGRAVFVREDTYEDYTVDVVPCSD